MSTLPLALVTGLYIWQAANYAAARDYGMCLAFAAYALANAGFIWASAK